MNIKDIKDIKLNTKLFINGEFVDSKSGQTIQVINPADQTVITKIARANKEDVDLAVKSARYAFENQPWANMDPHQRGKLMQKFASLLEKNVQELAMIQAYNNGMPIMAAKFGTMPLVQKTIQYYAGWSDKIKGQVINIGGPFFSYTKKQPIGVVAQIIPWNVPLIMLIWKISPVLASGCTTIVKTSQLTPLSAMKVAELIKQAGIPSGVINIIHGYGHDTGDYLAKHPGVDKISFTGSTNIGYKLIRQSHVFNLKRIALQLGGKSANIITANADIQAALSQATFAVYMNAGQVCIAGSRTFVHQSIYDSFCNKVVNCVKNMKVGNPLDPETKLGPLNNKPVFDRVLDYIQKGKLGGAKLLIGGKRIGQKGYFIEPTIFCDVTDDMVIAKQQIFGPVMCIFKYKTNQQALQRANNTMYGLGAGVMSQNIREIHYFVDNLKAGTVFVNCYNQMNPYCPFGGYKDSGIGRQMGQQGLNYYMETKSVIIRK